MKNEQGKDFFRSRLRGFFKYLVLYALREGPAHGYALMKKIGELMGVDYVPSSGVLYPTLHALEREGLVKSYVEGRRRVYELTEKGRKELESRLDEVLRFVESARRAHEIAKSMGLYRIANLVTFIVEKDIEVPEQVVHEIAKRVKEIEMLLRKAIERAGYNPADAVGNEW